MLFGRYGKLEFFKKEMKKFFCLCAILTLLPVFLLERGCRIIESNDTPIEDNEYRIALRVGEQPVVGPNGYPYLQWDYHFMVQTESGEWAEKCGSSSATILHTSGNPSIFQWDAATYPNFYTSDILYFAITN